MSNNDAEEDKKIATELEINKRIGEVLPVEIRSDAIQHIVEPKGNHLWTVKKLSCYS